MPRYFVEDEPTPKGGFNSFDEMTHFVTKASDQEWGEFQKIAHSYLRGTRVPKRHLKKKALHKIITSKAHHILPELHHELQQHYDQEDVGGGIVETIDTIGMETAHLLGIDWLAQVLGITPQTNVPQTAHSELMAYLVDQTYTSLEERPEKTLGYTRLEKYDNQKFGVYQNDKSGELVCVVRGTKMEGGDLVADAKILLGFQPESKDLDTMLDQLEKDFPGVKYDIAGHSLGTMYIFSEFEEHRDNMDDIYFFNPASSPLQNTDMLHTYANDPGVHYHINQGDVVSHGLYQQMDDVTFDAQVTLGTYVYSPIAAHSMTQWYDPRINRPDSLPPPGPDYDTLDPAATHGAEYTQDTPESQAANLS
jgi:hypothetical protein